MRTECSGTDAEEVIEIMKASMVDCHENELSMLDFSQSQGGSQRSKGSQIKQFVAGLQRIADKEGRTVFNVAELKELIANSCLKLKGGPMDTIHTLNENGFLLKKSAGNYQLSSTNY